MDVLQGTSKTGCDNSFAETIASKDNSVDATVNMKNSTDGTDVSKVTQTLRELTCEEKEALEKDTRVVTEFKQKKFEADAQKNWDLFYKRNTTKFFKDRHWTKREFTELVQTEVGKYDRWG